MRNPETTHTTISLTKDVRDRLKYYAIQRGCTVSALITSWVLRSDVRMPEKEEKGS